jgi:parallel beta helix pectate lyase-like protein/uncharacterized protein DUF1565
MNGFTRALVAVALAVAPPQQIAGPQRMQICVDGRSGSDAEGDGSADKPFKTIHRALVLQAQVPDRSVEIELALGHYGRHRGAVAAEPEKDREVIPIQLPPNVSLSGAGSESCEITGEQDQPIVLLADRGECRLAGVTLRGGATAIAASPIARGGRLAVGCVDLAIRDCADGIDLDLAAGSVAFRGDGLRVRGGKSGLHANGATRLDLGLSRCSFRECDEALRLDTNKAPPDGARHALDVSDCRFERGSGVAVRRLGSAPLAPDATPWRIRGSTFVGNEAGVALEIPNGDLPIAIDECDFQENNLFAISLVGSGEELEGASRIAGCRMRWNGVGVNLLSCGRKVELDRCRIEESTGNGLFAGLLGGKRSSVALSRCLVACNGSCGLFGLCETKGGLTVALERCTVADNRGHGVEQKGRATGAAFALERCIVAGNSADLFKVDPERLKECLLGKGSADAQRGVEVGDPKFVDRRGRDFRLAPDSPARRPDGVLGAFE